MKTSTTLTILGAYNALMGIIMLGDPNKFAIEMVGLTHRSPEVLEMAKLFLYGLSPALLTLGLTLILIRSCSMNTAKNALIAYIIGTGVLLALYFTVFSNSTVMNFSTEMADMDIPVFILINKAVPDMLAIALAVFGLVKAK